MNREQLFERHLRGELTAEEAAELKRLLAGDGEAGRAFVEYANETALLVRVGSQLQSTVPTNVVPISSLQAQGSGSGPEPERVVPRSSFRMVKLAALAACLVALAVVVGMLNREPARSRVPDVSVSGEGVQVTRDGVRLRERNFELTAGDVISTPTNQTAVIGYEHEFTRVTLQPGTVVVFGGAAHGKQYELRRGTMEAVVAPQPAERPMLVQTAHAFATVLGTEFVMRADERATKLDVLEGKVRLACRVTGRTVKVKAGFGATLNRKAPFNLAPLCKTNCILRECRDTNAIYKISKQRKNEI